MGVDLVFEAWDQNKLLDIPESSPRWLRNIVRRCRKKRKISNHVFTILSLASYDDEFRLFTFRERMRYFQWIRPLTRWRPYETLSLPLKILSWIFLVWWFLLGRHLTDLRLAVKRGTLALWERVTKKNKNRKIESIDDHPEHIKMNKKRLGFLGDNSSGYTRGGFVSFFKDILIPYAEAEDEDLYRILDHLFSTKESYSFTMSIKGERYTFMHRDAFMTVSPLRRAGKKLDHLYRNELHVLVSPEDAQKLHRFFTSLSEERIGKLAEKYAPEGYGEVDRRVFAHSLPAVIDVLSICLRENALLVVEYSV